MGKKRSILDVVSIFAITVFMVVALLVPYSWAQVATGTRFPTRVLGSIAAIGDSITQAYNAGYSEFANCRYTDNPQYSFSTNTTSNTTISIAERAITYKGSAVATANFGWDGAKMTVGVDQAQTAKSWALTQAAPRLITVFLGHNDICGGEKDKHQTSCNRTSQDPNNYCRTSAWNYEQQTRAMLDVLITIPSSQIAIIHPIRVSQLCNFAKEKAIDEPWLTARCEDLWATPELFGSDALCPSLTSCSAERIADAYTTWVAYRDIVNKVVEEYNQFAAGQTIPYNSTYNTGNVVRESGVFLQTTDVIGNSRFSFEHLSVCECFHPSKYGQNLVASALWDGVACSATTPCCNDYVEGDSDYNKGLCNTNTSGSMSGLWYTATAGYLDAVQKVYIGYYQRPADPGGLLYWADRLDRTNGNLNEMIEAYANSPESQALYGTINSSNIADVVNGIYEAFFGRDAEPGGLAWYMDGFNSGRYTAATIMLSILDGAQNQDLVAVNNKLTASNLFTRTIDPELDGMAFQVTYAGEPDATAARTFLTSVTDDLATIPTQDGITEYIRSTIADAGDPILSQ